MDSNRPREEWNLSHVRPDSQRATSPANGENVNKQIVTTQEEEMKALNNVLKDNLATEMSDAEFIFPGNGREQ